MSDEIWLARHGETDANAEGRVQGSLDPPLNERGREQARELAEQAAPLGLRALYTSQLLRARETAVIVGERIGLDPLVDERFAESWRGEWEGRFHAEIRAEDPEGWAASFGAGDEFRFPGGESLAEHAARVEAGLADVRRGPLPALVVCHGGTIRRVLAARLGLQGSAEEFASMRVPNGSIVQVMDGAGLR